MTATIIAHIHNLATSEYFTSIKCGSFSLTCLYLAPLLCKYIAEGDMVSGNLRSLLKLFKFGFLVLFLCSIVITIIRIILGKSSLSKQTKDTNFCWNYWTTGGMPQIFIVWVDLAVLCCSFATFVGSRQRCCITCNFLYWLLIFSFLRALFMLLWYFALVISHRPKELKVKIRNQKMHIYIYGFIFW